MKADAKKQKVHPREHAISELNRFFDARGVLEEDRIQPNLSAEEIKALEYMPEEEAVLAKEKSDGTREIVIKAIRQGFLEVSDEGDFKYTLQEPIKGEDGTVVLSEVKFRKRYQASEVANNMIGVGSKDYIGMHYAKIATRIGKSRLITQKIYDKDFDIIQAITMLF